MSESPAKVERSRKRSSLGEDLALRTARALKNARHQKALDLIRMKELVAKAWDMAKVQVQQEADNKATEFTFTFNYHGLFTELKPDVNIMRDALPDELTRFHFDVWQGNCINVGHDKVAGEFNIRLYWSPRAHEILREWDNEEDAAAQTAANEAACARI